MATQWYLPNTITQIAEVDSHIPWDSSANFQYLRYRDGTYTRTLKPLVHIPNSFSGDRIMKTWYLNFTNFKIDPSFIEIAGIQVKMRANRGGRITDDTVQLIHDGALIGINKARSSLSEIKYYGGKNFWDLTFADTTATISLITSSTFGVSIRFQSHPSWPHNVAPLLDYVEIRLLEPGDNPLDDYQESSGPRDVGDGDGEGGPGDGTGTGTDGTGSGKGKPGGKGKGGARGDLGNVSEPVWIPGTIELGNGYQGSVQYQGSAAYYGSTGYTGSVPQQQGSGGIVPPNSLQVQNFSDLPVQAEFYLQQAYIISTGEIYVYDGAWILIYRPPQQ